jgi:maltose alpha-D-glucosyltransferase/alpha-amylase
MASRTRLCEALREWIAEQRWFASKRRRIVAVALEDRVPIGPGSLWIARVDLDDGGADRYAVPLLEGETARDALDDPGFCAALLDLVARGARAPGGRGEVVAERTRAFPAGLAGDAAARRLTGEQSNTSIVFGDALILKHFRRLAAGPNPDVEITRFLTERTGFRHTPRLCGSLEYRDGAGAWALAMAQELVRDARDGWRWLLERLAEGDAALGPLHGLGRRTAELHLALGSDPHDPAFAPEVITPADVEAWTEAVQRQLEAARTALGGALPDGVPARIEAAGLGPLAGATKQRHHGDFHLGQTLIGRGGAEVAIIDFEGEPLRPLAERRRKHTPLRDVAGLLRSLGYAAASAPAPAGWEERAREAFLDGYREAAGAAPFLPRAAADVTRAIAVLEVEKAAYEIVYEANNRPDWIAIPVRGVIRAAGAVTAAPRWGRAAGAP